MPIENPKQVNWGIFYSDERNIVCKECAIRLFETTAGLEIVTDPKACTECTAFAAGTHPSLPATQKPDVPGTLTIDQIISNLENMGDAQASIVAEFLSDTVDINDLNWTREFIFSCMDEIIAAAQYVKANLK